jgi:hypothetical protein
MVMENRFQLCSSKSLAKSSTNALVFSPMMPGKKTSVKNVGKFTTKKEKFTLN